MKAPTIHLRPYVRGRRWVAVPSDNSVWILDDGDPQAIGQRTGEALAALRDAQRPTLRLVVDSSAVG